ncbi:MAG: flagellar motor protein [Acidobacteriia bacterium]|nr:flagellar motor protein [Terriglobia bacterium]
MAEAAKPATAPEAAKPAKPEAGKPAKAPKPASKAGATKPDLATMGGIALALAGILGGLILEKGSIFDVIQTTAAMIVLGGTFGAVLVTTPLPVFLRALRGLGGVFFERSNSASATIEALIQYATKARKNGIVSLETEAAAIADPFLKKALNLAVDGTDLQELRKMMEIDINLSEQTSEAEAKVWEAAGGYAPTVGIIGAVMGLIQVMKHLEDIKEVGHGIAVAFVATVYGVGCANIFFLPVANKLKARMHEATLLRDMTLEGVVGIVEGLNPKLIRMKLEAYHPPPEQPKKAAKSAKTAGPAKVPGPAKAAAGPARTAAAPQPATAGE